jgi:hypothetical protein
MRLRGALLVAVMLTVTAPAAAMADDGDSPWPSGASVPQHIRAVRAVVRHLEDRVDRMSVSVDRYARSRACLRTIPITEYGDPDRQFGFVYDERDGSGRGHMPALAVDRRGPARSADYRFLAYRNGPDCHSEAPQPRGTAEAASMPARPSAVLRDLERRAARLEREVRRLSSAAERFDRWESCVSQVPVTEYGDPDGGFGYAFAALRSTSFAFRPALAIDRSDWDDPDYMFLAFVGANRPGHECENEPGEAVD